MNPYALTSSVLSVLSVVFLVILVVFFVLPLARRARVQRKRERISAEIAAALLIRGGTIDNEPMGPGSVATLAVATADHLLAHLGGMVVWRPSQPAPATAPAPEAKPEAPAVEEPAPAAQA